MLRTHRVMSGGVRSRQQCKPRLSRKAGRPNGLSCAIQGEWEDLRQMPRPPKTLEARISAAVALDPCEVLFVHRDAENASRHVRRSEIAAAVQAAISLLLT